MMKKEKVVIGYKSVTDDLKSGNGDCQWVVGEWKKFDGELKMCKSGFHASRHPLDVWANYMQGNRFFLVEAKGKIFEQKDKFVCSEMRLTFEFDLKRLAVKFAIWNAKRVLPNFLRFYPKDNRPGEAIKAAENWLNAKTSAVESAVWFAAESAAESAWSADRSAAESAARFAAYAAYSAWSADRSAADAARFAAYTAKSVAYATSAAWSEVRRKLLQMFKEELKNNKKVKA